MHSIGSVKTIVNGNVLEDRMIDATYNGNKLDINAYDKGEEKHMQLTNADIMKLLAKPASPISLEKRLIHDFDISVKKVKKSKKTKKSNKYKKVKKSKTIKKCK